MVEDIRGEEEVQVLLTNLKDTLCTKTGMTEENIVKLWDSGLIKVKGRARKMLVFIDE